MTTTLKVQNCYSWLNTDNETLHTKLFHALRFLKKGYYHTAPYRRGVWDGYVNFYSRAGMFLTGLLPEVLAALDFYKVEYETIDERFAPEWLHTEIGPHFLDQWLPKGVNPVELHDYQYDLVNQAIKCGRGLIKAPTGAGKTFVLISLLKCLPPTTPVLFMTKASSLVDQNYEEMKKWGIPNLGRYYDGHKELNRIMCVTAHVDTLKALGPLLPKFKGLIVDEVHECMSDVPKKAYDKMKAAAIRFGISATPFKFTKRNTKTGREECKDQVHKFGTKGYFGSIIKTTTTKTGILTTKYLQERNILSGSDCTFYFVDEPKNIIHEPYGDAVTLGIAHNFHFLQLVQRLALSLKGRSLILVERIDQGDYMKQLLPNAYWIQGADSVASRAEVFKELRESPNAIAISMRHIITAGINVYISNLINAAGGQAEHSVIQQLGRGLRTAADKDILRYYDFVFRTNQYLAKHSMNRIKILQSEKHQVRVKEEYDF